jgi:hypothetical protein
MVCRTRVGHVSSTAAGHAYANYVEREALAHTRALYYAADAPDRADDRPRNHADKLTRDAQAFAEIRSDIDRRQAEKLGIALDRPLTLQELGNLLNAKRADGEDIEGKQKRRESKSLAETLKLDTARLPTADEIARVLEGRRADGKPLPANRVEGVRSRFLEALGAPKTATADEIAALAPDREDYLRRIKATSAPVAFVDFSFHPDKSISAALRDGGNAGRARDLS